MAGEAAPVTQYTSVAVASAGAGADTIGVTVAPFAGTLASADVYAFTTLTGANTDSRTLQVINRGQTGGGTTVMASKAYTSGVNATAERASSLTLSAVAGATTVAAGDVIEVQSTHIGGTGLAGPQLVARLGFSRTAGS